MKAYVITLEGDDLSENAADKLIVSSLEYNNPFTIEKINAVTPSQVYPLFNELGTKWNYPLEGSVLDISSGLYKQAYETKDIKKRMACFLSHYLIWLKHDDEPVLVFEHDALFTKKLSEETLNLFSASKYSIISLNDPRGVTRKSKQYYDQIISSSLRTFSANYCVAVPTIDDMRVPQGLPGNSAYMIKPMGGELLKSLVKEFGAWPNDAIMCKQLMPNQLGCAYPFYTITQKIQSTTTL